VSASKRRLAPRYGGRVVSSVRDSVDGSDKRDGAVCWECSVRELRVHDPATAEQHSLKGKGFLTTADWHEIRWEIELDRMRVVVDGEVRFEGAGDYSGIESAPSVGPCFGSTVSIREFSITPLLAR
jgi:hypothetical protein